MRRLQDEKDRVAKSLADLQELKTGLNTAFASLKARGAASFAVDVLLLNRGDTDAVVLPNTKAKIGDVEVELRSSRPVVVRAHTATRACFDWDKEAASVQGMSDILSVLDTSGTSPAVSLSVDSDTDSIAALSKLAPARELWTGVSASSTRVAGTGLNEHHRAYGEGK